MGLPIKTLYCTNINLDSVLLAAWRPEKRDDGKYYMPDNTAIGYDVFIPNVLGLKPDESVEVEIIESEKETGIWLICYDDFFGSEQHLYTYKPRFKEGTKIFDYEYDGENSENFGLHVCSDIKMEAGDGPISVTLRRKDEKV